MSCGRCTEHCKKGDVLANQSKGLRKRQFIQSTYTKQRAGLIFEVQVQDSLSLEERTVDEVALAKAFGAEI